MMTMASFSGAIAPVVAFNPPEGLWPLSDHTNPKNMILQSMA
jgi:hypothetical protein